MWGTCLRIGPYIPSDRRTHDPSALAQTVAEPERAHRYLRTRAEFGCVLFEPWASAAGDGPQGERALS